MGSDGSSQPRRSGVGALLDSRSIMVVGASDRPGSAGLKAMTYLAGGSYTGEVLAVNPRLESVLGVPCVGTISDHEGRAIDHALLLVPGSAVLGAVEQCGRIGVRAASIYAGAVVDGDGADGRDRLRELAQEHGMRLLGPNCLGVVNAHTGLIASSANSWTGIGVEPGRVSVIGQSGAVGTYLVGLLEDQGLGLRYYVSTGDEVDLGLGEILDHVAEDPETRVVLVYLEGLRDPDAFVAALDRARRGGTTVIVIKAGSTTVGAAAVQVHTAALAGDDAVYDAVLAEGGALRARTLEEAISAARVALTLDERARPPRATLVLTSSGGLGIMTAEALERRDLTMPPIGASVRAEVLEVLPHATGTNPLDGSAEMPRSPETYEQVLRACFAADHDSAVVSLSSLGRSEKLFGPLRERLLAVADEGTLVLQGSMRAEDRASFWAAGIASAEDPDAAAALLALRRDLLLLRERARTIVPSRPTTGDAVPLRDDEAMQLLAGEGVPLAPWRAVPLDRPLDPEALEGLVGPFAVKVARRGVLHKADLGLVVLDVPDADAVEVERERLAAGPDASPDDRILVQQMVGGATLEMLVGLTTDATFGHVGVVALGGALTELYGRRAIVVPPFDRDAVERSLRRLDTLGVLDGFRGSGVLDRASIVDPILTFLHAVDRPDVVDAEMNPLLVGPDRPPVAIDAVIRMVGPIARPVGTTPRRTTR